MFWEALQLLALADPSDLVALEAIRAMFGAPSPRAESLKKRAAGRCGTGRGAWHAYGYFVCVFGAPSPALNP